MSERRCQYEGCTSTDTLECPMDDSPVGEMPDWFCPKHAPLMGHCGVCGSFWGGVDEFETAGICPHCRDDMRADCDDVGDEMDYVDDDGEID